MDCCASCAQPLSLIAESDVKADQVTRTGDPVEALPTIREVATRFNLTPRKSFGQHFLFDLNIARRIARVAGDLSGGTVVEIGPGPGALTRGLLLCGAKNLVAVERDQRCVAALAETIEAAAGRLHVIEADARKFDLQSAGPPPVRVVANLPYGIGSHLLTRWMPPPDGVQSFTLMFQREVATRLTAAPGSQNYGRLSVLSQACCEVRSLFTLPPEAFVPAPAVHSTLVQLDPKPDRPSEVGISELARTTQAAFGMRRKKLRTALARLGDPEELLREAEISPDLRAERISVEDFLRLARILGARRG